MSDIRCLRDGETYSHSALLTLFGFKTERAMKDQIDRLNVPYVPINGTWWVSGEDLRKAIQSQAMTHTERREEKAS